MDHWVADYRCWVRVRTGANAKPLFVLPEQDARLEALAPTGKRERQYPWLCSPQKDSKAVSLFATPFRELP